jgi:hypothetical protein
MEFMILQLFIFYRFMDAKAVYKWKRTPAERIELATQRNLSG